MSNQKKPSWWDICMSGPAKEDLIQPEVAPVIVPSKKKSKLKILFILFTILFLVGIYFYLDMNKVVKPTSIQIYCDSYILSNDSNQITCNVISQPKGSSNSVTWQMNSNSDVVSMENGTLILQNNTIDTMLDIRIKAISTIDTTIETEEVITILPLEDLLVLPSCSIAADTLNLTINEQFLITVTCNSDKRLIYRTKLLEYDTNYFELINTENKEIEKNKFTHTYYFRTLKDGSSIITLPTGYATANNIKNYKSTLKLDIVELVPIK